MSVFQFSEHPEVLWADLYLNIGGSIGKSAVGQQMDGRTVSTTHAKRQT